MSFFFSNQLAGKYTNIPGSTAKSIFFWSFIEDTLWCYTFVHSIRMVNPFQSIYCYRSYQVQILLTMRSFRFVIGSIISNNTGISNSTECHTYRYSVAVAWTFIGPAKLFVMTLSNPSSHNFCYFI